MTTRAIDTQFGDELLDVINADISLDPDQPIDLDTDLLVTGLVDSLGVVQIVNWLEHELGIEIDPGDVVLEHFQTVGRILAFVTRAT